MKSLGIKSATKFRDQLKEITTVVDDAIVEALRSDEEATEDEEEPTEIPDVSETAGSDDDKPLPYGRNSDRD